MKESFIDLHCHLDHCKDIEGIVERAKSAGVNIILTAGVSRATNKEVIKLAEKYPEVRACLGLYPIDALSMKDKDIDSEIEHILTHKDKIVAIGEVGMDFKEDLKEHMRQDKVFRKFVQLSMNMDKPIIIHSRKAERECIEILEEMGVKKVVMHCFCGKRSLVERIIKNGWFLTIPTSVKNSLQFQENAKIIPIGQIFCETDSPFLHPDKLSNNEPANVIASYEMIAKIKEIGINEVRKKVFENFEKLFG